MLVLVGLNWRQKLSWRADIPEFDVEPQYSTNAGIALIIAKHAFTKLMNALPNSAQDLIPWQTFPEEFLITIDEEFITDFVREKIKQWTEGIEKGDIFAEV